MRKISPCRGCDRRTITCHGVCAEYQSWKAVEEERKEKAHKEREKEFILAKKRTKDNPKKRW